MTKKLAHRLSIYFVRRGIVEDGKRDLLEYGIFHILSSILHIALLAAAGIIFSVPWEIAVYAVFFRTIKGYIGGAHATKHWQCLWSFTAMALIAAVFCKRLVMMGCPVYLPTLLGAAALVIVIIRAPVLHPNAPKRDKQKMLMFRSRAIFISVLQLAAVGICCFWLPALSLCASAGSMSASVTLLLPVPNPNGKGGEKNEEGR